MDKMNDYRQLVKKILSDLAAASAHHGPDPIETSCAFDDERNRYLLLSVGWHGDRRVSGTTIHARLANGKIFIEEDWTEEGIATQLVAAGVPHQDIVLAFHPPGLRHLSEFAVA